MANNSAGLDASLSSLNSFDNDTSVPSSANLDTQPSKWTSASTSFVASPTQSREPSPTPPFVKSGRTSRASITSIKSRKNSTQDPSPPRTRSAAYTSSATSTPTSRRQLSSATTPTLPAPPTSDAPLRAPVPQKLSVASESSRDSPRWPVSPRLKSPPPVLGRPAVSSAARRNDPEPPLISVQRATPSPHVEPVSQSASESEVEDPYPSSGMRTPARGPSNGSSTLETVQEVSQPNTPRPGLDAALERLAEAQNSTRTVKQDGTRNRSIASSQNTTNSESGSDSGSTTTNTRRSSAATPVPPLHNRQSSTTLKFGGGRGQTSGESSSRNMTVETEEVKSIPQMSLVPNPAGVGMNGSLRTRPSSETIKPRKEKKKHTRKTTTVTSGNGEPPNPPMIEKLWHSCPILSISSAPYRPPTNPRGPISCGNSAMLNPRQQQAGSSKTRPPSLTTHVTKLLTRGPRPASSKADIFEATVASAVEEANSSDSDETFVYDSNPPDVVDRPRRFHSRTPSTTSMASQIDRSGMRSIHGMMDSGAPTLPLKKNMKFVNTHNSSGNDSIHGGEDDGRGTGRSNAGSARGTGRHHHHANRWGRNNNNNHLSLFDNESPFPNASRPKFTGNNSRQSSNPTSPRYNTGRGWISAKRQMTLPGGYDLDDSAANGADDERTPLLNTGTARSLRSNRNRRTPMSRNLEAQAYRQRPSFLNRFASCLVLTVMLMLVISGAIGFMFATSQPLTEIQLVKIGNVLASEQELMMDITVKAHNPNVVVVMIDSADLEIFAKSPHAGTDSEWWRHPHGDEFGTLDDPKDDPPDLEDPPPDDTAPNMRLGNVLTFDSPLSYEGSFFQSGLSTSTGSLRLTKPGNGTDSGTERWERIISDDFTLIVKGVLKYTLPLSQKVRSVAISGKTLVKPNSANDPSLRPNGTDVGIY
ncbi:vacuolar segregation subunit 7-domain-containing protein [Camillea tinctor]|nr:vacuolar segregation subunit 7-domain-containing protein [Camillea tinctor]